MTEDKKISEAVELLLKGAKMLGYHCPDCLLPVFQQDEKIFCSHCKKEFRVVEEDGRKKIIPVNEEKRSDKSSAVSQPSIKISGIEAGLSRLFEKLIEKALIAESTAEIRELVHIMRELAEIYKIVVRE